MPDAVPAAATGPLYALGERRPRVAADAFVAPNAALIGDVMIGAQSGVWFACVLRADTSEIRVGARTNIQDGTIVHVNHGMPTRIGDDVTIGHAAIIHACTLLDRAFVGMGATVLDGAVIEEGGVLAAGALLTPGKRIGRLELWQGAPARLARTMTPTERERFDGNAVQYIERAAEFRALLRGL
ncbi:MAG: gamma carbonic anhydrase family protein [Rhodospirillales bacterium]|nr:gamma carbonic anhydrase family protein [Rhodospirillales bacterium]